MATQWFYSQYDKKYGPLTGKQMKELATVGLLHPDDLIWSAGFPDWKAAKLFIGLFPKTDNGISPSMSVLWKLDEAEGSTVDKLQGLLLEPDGPETAATPPLPKKNRPRVELPRAEPIAAPRPRPAATAQAPARPVMRKPAVATAPAPPKPAAKPAPAPPKPAVPKPTLAPAVRVRRKDGLPIGLTLAISGAILSLVSFLVYLIIS